MSSKLKELKSSKKELKDKHNKLKRIHNELITSHNMLKDEYTNLKINHDNIVIAQEYLSNEPHDATNDVVKIDIATSCDDLIVESIECNTPGVYHQLSNGFELKHDMLSGDDGVKIKSI